MRAALVAALVAIAGACTPADLIVIVVDEPNPEQPAEKPITPAPAPLLPCERDTSQNCRQAVGE